MLLWNRQSTSTQRHVDHPGDVGQKYVKVSVHQKCRHWVQWAGLDWWRHDDLPYLSLRAGWNDASDNVARARTGGRGRPAVLERTPSTLRTKKSCKAVGGMVSSPNPSYIDDSKCQSAIDDFPHSSRRSRQYSSFLWWCNRIWRRVASTQNWPSLKCLSFSTGAPNANIGVVKCDIQRQTTETGNTPGDECWVEAPDGRQYVAAYRHQRRQTTAAAVDKAHCPPAPDAARCGRSNCILALIVAFVIIIRLIVACMRLVTLGNFFLSSAGSRTLAFE